MARMKFDSTDVNNSNTPGRATSLSCSECKAKLKCAACSGLYAQAEWSARAFGIFHILPVEFRARHSLRAIFTEVSQEISWCEAEFGTFHADKRRLPLAAMFFNGVRRPVLLGEGLLALAAAMCVHRVRVLRLFFNTMLARALY